MPTSANTPLPPLMLCHLCHPKSQPRAPQLHLATHQLRQRLLPTLSHHSPQHLQSNPSCQQHRPPIIHILLHHILPSSHPTSQCHLSNHPSRQLSLYRRLHPPQCVFPGLCRSRSGFCWEGMGVGMVDYDLTGCWYKLLLATGLVVMNCVSVSLAKMRIWTWFCPAKKRPSPTGKLDKRLRSSSV